MVVVDANVLASRWVETPHSALSRRARSRDSTWIAPPLWRSEVRSVLRKYLLHEAISYADALWAYKRIHAVMRTHTYDVDTADVLKLVQLTGHSAYDCEYVALAQSEGVPLITADKKLARLFPNIAVLLADFVA
ncbi:MAG: type II toxin-antitoxin system VapC family toxin [Bacteroidota bacterium]